MRIGIADFPRRISVAPAVLIIAGISFVAHVLVGTNYGYFRDELYLVAMSHHPGFGYVDVPPLVPWVTLIPRLLTGNALQALHVISALVCAVMSMRRCTRRAVTQGRSRSQAMPMACRNRWRIALAGREQVALIAQVYHSLPPDEQRISCIFTANYGEASALMQFGPRYQLPPPISAHNAFYLWGPDGCSGQALITINVAPHDAAQGYGSVTLAARTSCAACVAYENNAPVLILRQPKAPFEALWRQAKHYD